MANPHPTLVVGRTLQEAQDHITTHNLPRDTIAAGTRNITRRTQGLNVSEVRLLKTALDHLHAADLHHLRMIEARGKPMSDNNADTQPTTQNRSRAMTHLIEYRAEVRDMQENGEWGVWHPVTKWTPDWPLQDDSAPNWPSERVMARRKGSLFQGGAWSVSRPAHPHFGGH